MPELTGKQIELYRNLRTIEAAVKAGYKLPPDDSGHWPERGYPDAEGDAPIDPSISIDSSSGALLGDLLPESTAVTPPPGVSGTTYPAHVDPPAPQPSAFGAD